MSADNIEEPTTNNYSQGSDMENQAILFEEINQELESYLAKESNNRDATDSILQLSTISDSVQEEFDRKEVCQGTVKCICIKHKGQRKN